MAAIGNISVTTPASFTSAQASAGKAFAPPPAQTALPSGHPRMLALGLDGLIALLSEDSAKQMRKDARDGQRAERDAQLAAIGRQVSELREKASAMRSEAAVTAAFTIAGGAGQCASAGAGTSSAAKAWGSGFKTGSDLAAPMGKLTYGGAQIEHEAEATRAASDAKRAESAADEYAALMKNADATIDKAHQALQQLAQMRSQLMQTHGVYRPM
jgi:hypothetical protein